MNLAEQVHESHTNIENYYQGEIVKLEEKRFIEKQKINRFLSIVPTIEKIAYEKKMTIESFSTNSGRGFSFVLIPKKDSRFVFIKDQGFDCNGRGKNQKQLESKAQKIANWFTSNIENITFNVNPFSLENSSSKQILCELRFKNQ